VDDDPGIVILRDRRIEPSELKRLVLLYFEDMVKYVVDVERGVVAVGGQMHPAVRARVRDLTHALVGEGEPLP
jgi:hypothetical protein